MRSFCRGKKVAQDLVYFCNFQSDRTKQTIAQEAKNLPIWSSWLPSSPHFVFIFFFLGAFH
jgi:hypothetical protein